MCSKTPPVLLKENDFQVTVKKKFFIVLKRNSSLEIKTDKLESMAELKGSVSVDSFKKVSQ